VPRCAVDGLVLEHGGRQLINAIIDVTGQHCILRNPQINSSAGANFGVLLRDDAEFFGIFDGEIVGNYLASSVGIQCGDGSKVVGAPATGQLKCYDVKIRNWDIGVRITGSSDTPEFFGCTIANNKTWQVEIDSQRGADIWPVSGLGFFGCYSECVAFPAASFLHLKSGLLASGVITACYIGYNETAVKVEAAMSDNALELLGCRFPATAAADAVTTPNVNSSFYSGRNTLSVSNNISKGAFAAKAWSIDDSIFNTVKVNTSMQVGATGDAYFQENFSFFTANFAAGVPALDMVELPFVWAPALVVRMLTFCVNGALAATTALTFECYVSSNGNFNLRARNNTAVAVGAVAGTLFVRSTKII